ncbi:hypothetical protein AB0F72_10925 [Actinoplanes sp. NPDC023936]|uniref:hypothetical protein n=1 Tax=Actinoplanes sp. NPDC023936 TaxID=3154910 RepID=UPI0033C98704
MTSKTQVFRIDGSTATPFKRASMVEHKLLETNHLEEWVVANPQILGGNILVVAQQYAGWQTTGGDTGSERLDILGLDSTGQLVVVELKRQSDKRVHLQALTYGALVAGFTKEILASAHANYASSRLGESLSLEEALLRLRDHVEGEWGDELLTRPRIVLVAEHFPPQVMTTVNWLAELAPDLIIQCVELSVFQEPEESAQLCATFQRIYPVEDIADRILGPTGGQQASGVSVEIAERARRQRSVQIIVENDLIPEGAQLELRLETFLKPEDVTTVNQWISDDPERRKVTWVTDKQRPLRWAIGPQSSRFETWSASKLAQHIIEESTGHNRTVSGPDVWNYDGYNLYTLANDSLEVPATE